MANLTVGGVVVPIGRNGADIAYDEIGGEAVTRMFDGTARLTRRGQKRKWSITTAVMADGAATTLLAQLQSTTLPVACSGDVLGGSVSCIPTVDKKTAVGAGGALSWVLAFTLWEA